jgi:hypothetical protein
MLLNPYVTSTFQQHSALSSVNVVGNITRICAFPLIANLSDLSQDSMYLMLELHTNPPVMQGFR